MDQPTIAIYLERKGLSARAIHQDLVATLGQDAVADSTVTRYLREIRFHPSTKAKASIEIPQVPDDSDEAILAALREAPFASVRQLARLTHISAAKVYRRLTRSLGFTARHLRWVPHSLSDAQKQERVEQTQLLLRKLTSEQRRGWHDIVTLDESWFYLTTQHESIWFPETEKVPERERPMIQSKKLMLTIIWNPQGFHLINVLPKGQKFNADYYITYLLSTLSQWRRNQRGASDRKLLVHADNARPHTALASMNFLDAHGMKKAPHPPYSPDLAPSDFYLFGYLKHCLAGESFADSGELLQGVKTILTGIQKTTLEAVSLEWME
jgi:histone-lysine N-methyltransferase SETMAR